MFKNPFGGYAPAAQFPNEKCRWCLKRIGFPNFYPIPLCERCYMGAYHEGGKPWERVCSEFETEFRARIRKMRAAAGAGMARVDVLSDAHEAVDALVDLGKLIDQAMASGDNYAAGQLQLEMARRIDQLERFKKEQPELVAKIEKEEEQG